MRTLPLALFLILTSSILQAAPKAKKAPVPTKAPPPLEFVLKAGDVAEAKVIERLEKVVVDELRGGRVVPGKSKLYQTDKESVPFYQVSFLLEPEAGKKLEALTGANRDKKLVVKAGTKKISEAWIKDAIGTGPIVIEPDKPKYDAKSDGTKESAQSKANAEKLSAELQKLIKKP
jgi:hypothetical protein